MIDPLVICLIIEPVFPRLIALMLIPEPRDVMLLISALPFIIPLAMELLVGLEVFLSSSIRLASLLEVF